MATEPTDDELRALEAAPAPATTPDVAPRAVLPEDLVPKPSPEIAARAKEIGTLVSGIATEVDGKALDTIEGTKPVTDVKPKGDWPGKPPEPAIEARDRASFLVSILSNKPFTKTYDLFAGAVRVTFQTRTAAQDDMCAGQVHSDRQSGLIATGDVLSEQYRASLFGYVARYQLVCSLVMLERDGQPKEPHEPAQPPKTRGEAREVVTKLEQLMAATSMPLYSAISGQFAVFEQLVTQLTMEARSPSFWQAGPAT